MKYNVWNKWGKLRTVMLGRCYHPEFFRDIKETRIRDALTRITEETIEDLENYEKVLKDFGCEVIIPKLDAKESIMEHIDDHGKLRSIPRSPLQPRDGQLVIGNNLYYSCLHGTSEHPAIKEALDSYDESNIILMPDPIKHHPIFSKSWFDKIKGADWLTYDDYLADDYYSKVPPFVKQEIQDFKQSFYFSAPSMTVVGKDIYVDMEQLIREEHASKVLNNMAKYLSDYLPFMRVNILKHGGHSDSCFHTLKPGAILSLEDIQPYQETFPGWDVCYLPDQSWILMEDFLRFKGKVQGKWWVPGEEDNDGFVEFVETWLQDWVGYCEESVFDVNVLMLDDKHVCVNNYNELSFEFFKKHKIEPIIVPWRHRYFWDGGLHCITLDLKRDGELEDYFPNRKKSINQFS